MSTAFILQSFADSLKGMAAPVDGEQILYDLFRSIARGKAEETFLAGRPDMSLEDITRIFDEAATVILELVNGLRKIGVDQQLADTLQAHAGQSFNERMAELMAAGQLFGGCQ